MQATSDGVYAISQDDEDLRAMIRDLVRMVLTRSMR